MPHFNHASWRLGRAAVSPLLIALPMIWFTGCSSLWRGNTEESDQAAALKELMAAPDPPDLIRDATAPHGMRPIEVDGVGVVNGLPGTGGPPDPSRFRDELIGRNETA